MKLEKVVPFGRSLDEYRQMFLLTDAGINKNFFTVSCGSVTPPDGAVVFTGTVTGCSGFVDADSVSSLKNAVQDSVQRY